MNYDLSVFERITLLNVLPNEGNITTIRLLKELKDALSFSEEEHENLQFQELKDANGATVSLKWKNEHDKPKSINIGRKMAQLIEDTMVSLSRVEKLKTEHLPLYDKFVEEKIQV